MKVLACDCGLAFWFVSEDELFSEARRHARQVHHMEFTVEQLRARLGQREEFEESAEDQQATAAGEGEHDAMDRRV